MQLHNLEIREQGFYRETDIENAKKCIGLKCVETESFPENTKISFNNWTIGVPATSYFVEHRLPTIQL